MKIGYPCIPLGVSYKTTRKFLLKNYNEELLYSCIDNNLDDLLNILKYNKSNNILMFRISSDIIPFGSHEINLLDWKKEFSNKLLEIGKYAKDNNIRLSMHPGQYTVINSPDLNILKRSIADLKYHCDFLDSLGIDKKNKIILHVGGVYGDKISATERFIQTYKSLDKNILDRLIIENDEKNYSLDDLLNISHRCNVPIVFDNLHHFCYEGSIDIKNALKSAFSTWNYDDGPPKVHYSEQDKNKRLGSHSQSIDINNVKEYIDASDGLDFDVMIEVKDKDFSAFKFNNFIEFKDKNIPFEIANKEFNRYKYYLLQRSLDHFNTGRDLLFNEGFYKFYSFLDKSIYDDISTELSLKAFKDFKENFSHLKTTEENYLNKLFLSKDLKKIKDYFLKLSLRYKIPNILENYFLFF
ncbi:UV DNA damage repair endonuclease UvsE [Clostridium thermobutyricum]